MSHTTRRKTSMKNIDVLKKAVERIPGAQYLGIGASRTAKNGAKVQLPGWNYPVSIDLVTGEASYDNYNGAWGDGKYLDQLAQGYGIEAAKSQAALEGRACEEVAMADGSVKCIISLGGGYETEGGGGKSGWDV